MPDSQSTNPAAAPTLPPSGDPATLVLPSRYDDVPGYEILAELGRGGMGVIYKARQLSLNRSVALKMILAGGQASVADCERFRDEAQAVARLHHPNIVQVHEVGEYRGRLFFSLELCEGGSLDRRLNGTPWDSYQAAALTETLARALQHAHDQGIIHRDLKPANILIADCGSTNTDAVVDPLAYKVADFGLAKSLDGTSGRTATGAILGTPSYMAPEQAGDSKKVGPWTDVYALGAILYELLTGRPPFRAATPLDTILQVVNDEPVPPARMNGQVPTDLNTICLKCLNKEPAKRYASATALADDLHRFQSHTPIAARPISLRERCMKWAQRRPAVAALSAISLLAVVGGFAGVLWQLRIASAARTNAETQTGIATQRANDLAHEQARVRRELHQSDLLRADLLMQTHDFAKAEDLLWHAHFTRPDDDDQRAYWRLWDLYRQRPRRSGWWAGAADASMHFSPDGRTAVLVRDRHVTIRNAADGAPQAEFDLTQTEAEVAGFSRDGKRLGIVSRTDGSITIWDLDGAPKLKAHLPPGSPTKGNFDVALIGALYGMPADVLERSQRILAHSATAICFLDQDRALVCDQSRATIWDLNGPNILTGFELKGGTWFSLYYSGTGQMTWTGDAVAVCRNGTISLWEIPRRPDAQVMQMSLDFSDPSIFHRLAEGEKPPKAVARPSDSPVIGVPSDQLIAANKKWLVTRDLEQIHVWDFITGKHISAVDSPAQPSVTFAMSPDETQLCAYGDEIHCWRLPNLQSVGTIPTLNESAPSFLKRAAMNRDGTQQFVAVRGIVGTYIRDNPRAEIRFDPPAEFKLHPFGYNLAASGPVVARKESEVFVWGDGPAGAIKAGSSWNLTSPDTFHLTPSGTVGIDIDYGVLSTTVTTYDLKQRRKIATVRVRDAGKRVTDIGRNPVAPDGQRIAVCVARAVQVYELPTLREINRVSIPPGGDEQLEGVEWSPDGGRLVLYLHSWKDQFDSSGPSIELVTVDASDGRKLAESRIRSESIFGFSPDGAVFASFANGKLILRDGATFERISELPIALMEFGRGAFSPDGKLFAIGEKTKLRLWDAKRWQEIAMLDLFTGNVTSLVFTPNSRKLRYVTNEGAGEIDLHAYDPYVAGNLGWNLERLIPELYKSGGRVEVERVLDRVKATDAAAYQAGRAALDALTK